MRTKAVSFFYDQITAEFAAQRTYDLDWQSEALAVELRTHREHERDLYIVQYADCVTYTQKLKFNWHQDIPAEYRQFEEFWKRVQRGLPAVDCFDYFAAQISNHILMGSRGWIDEGNRIGQTIGWNDALVQAVRIWVPPETKPVEDLSDEERADPN